MSQATAPIAEGDVLAGKYRVERVLGVGGMGVVVAARHLQLEQKVALKFLLPEAFKHEGSVERFLREARAAAKLKGQHVARVIDVGELQNGAPYMVMEYLEGSDLAHLIQREGALPIDDAIKYVLEACEAIAEAHAAGIVHRDLKPANLFRTKAADGSPTIKVLDFGISKIKDAASDPEKMALTKTHALLGSPLYMSPEAMKSAKKVAEPTDQWALGVILFECLTGTRPFVGESITELAYNVMAEPHPRPRALRPEIPEKLEAVIDRVLMKDPAQRYPSVGELAWALSECGSKPFTQSAERIGRMLGTSGTVRMEKPVEAKSVPPGPNVSTTAPTGSQTAATWSPATEKRAPPTATLSRFAIPIAAGLVVLAIGIAVVVPRVLRHDPEPSADATSAPSANANATSPSATAIAATAASAPPSETPSSRPSAPAGTAIEITPSQVAPPPTSRPRADDDTKTKTKPTATPIVTATVAPIVTATAAIPVPTATPSAKKNPLNIDIK